MNKKAILACLALSGLLLAGCGGGDKKPSQPGDSSVAPTTSQPVVNKYTVTWTHPDTGVLRVDENVAEGITPVYGAANPTKPSTAEYVYEFSGWTPTPGPISGNTTYTATFNQQPRQYSVKFYDDAEHLIHEDSLAYGSMPSYPVNPSKEGTAEYTYNFDHWDKDLEQVHSDQTYIAHFNASKNHYDVYFLSEDGIIELDKDEAVEYGAAPVYDAAVPTKDKTATITYTFDGWTSDGGEHVYATNALPVVTGETLYRAHFAESKTKYTVKFINWNDDLLDTFENIDYDDESAIDLYEGTPTCDEDPTRNYVFDGFIEQPIDSANYIRTFKATFHPTNTKVGALSYVFNTDHYVINGWNGNSSETLILTDKTYNDGINGEHPISEVGVNAFRTSSLISVELPDSIIKIGDYSFFYCGDLVSVHVKGNPVIGQCAFQSATKLDSFVMDGTGAYSINDNAFMGCPLTHLTLGSGLTNIGKSAFVDSQFTSFAKFDNLALIGPRAFQGNTNLSSVEFGNSLVEIKFNAFNGCTALESIELPDSVTTLESEVFNGCTSLSSFKIGLGYKSFTTDIFGNDNSIAAYSVAEGHDTYVAKDGVLFSVDETELIAFPQAKGGDYVVPEGTTDIRAYAFYGTDDLNSVTLAEGITTVTSGVFKHSGVKTINLPASLQSIMDHAFDGSTVESIIIGKNVSYIDATAFIGCTSLTNVTVDPENTLFAIEDLVVYNADKSTLRFVLPSKSGSFVTPSSVTHVNEYAFASSTLESITISNEVVSLGQNTFDGASSDITIGTGVTNIPSNCFARTTSDNITLLGNVTSLGERAFTYSAITSFEAPASLKGIYSYCFEHAESLVSIDLKNVETIGTYAFAYCTFTSISIPSSITSISNGAFAGNVNLAAIDLSATSITSVNPWIFSSCSNLVTVSLPSGVTMIGDSAFNRCYELTTINIPDSVEYIGSGAFNACEKLSAIVLPAALNDLRNGAYSGCPATEATYHGTTAQWEAFKNDRSSSWANFSVLTVVHCSNGNYPVDGVDNW